MAKRPKPRGQNGTLTLERLMERVAEFVAAQPSPEHLGEPVDALARVVGSAAAPVVAALPPSTMSPAALRVAVAAGADVEAPIAALLAAAGSQTGYEGPARAAATLIRALGLVGERDDLRGAIESLRQPLEMHFQYVVDAWVEIGRLDEAQADATRWLAANDGEFSMFVEAGSIGRMAGALAPTDFATAKRWMETIRADDRATAIEANVAGFARLADDDLDTLLSMVDRSTKTSAAARLAEALRATGREDAARRVRLAPVENDLDRVEALRELGDDEGARAVLREGTPPEYAELDWPRHKIALGVEPLDELWRPFAKVSAVSKSVMSVVQRLSILCMAALERGADAAELDPLLQEQRKFIERGPKTQYDHGVADRFIQHAEALALQARAQTADEAELRAWFEARRKALKGISSDTKSQRIGLQVRFALTLDLPDEAYKTAKKASPKTRPGHAAAVVKGYLPEDPAGALAALEGLAAKDARKWLAGALAISRARV